MKNLWNEQEASAFSDSELNARVYSSRLLGANTDLVLHGGGNTSVKSIQEDIFGKLQDVLFVKGSGWDLKTIKAEGFSPSRLSILRGLAELPSMTDIAMARELKASMIDPTAPSPSVEAILHALIPSKFVDHTHADAIVAISNTPHGSQTLNALFEGKILILPYVMPGFVLAKQIYDVLGSAQWDEIEGIVLAHHGIITFGDTAKESYDQMIRLVTMAEEYLDQQDAISNIATSSYKPVASDYLIVAQARKAASEFAGKPMLAHWKLDPCSVGFSALENAADLANRGPLTPDHTIHTKRTAAVNKAGDLLHSLEEFAKNYIKYFARNQSGQDCLDPSARYAIWQNRGVLAFGRNAKRARVVSDLIDHTLKSIQHAEKLGGWTTLDEKDIFELEYWDLEQAKLKLSPGDKEFDGKIALITGAASGIGRASVHEFLAKGAAVVALDINKDVETQVDSPAYLGLTCDATDSTAVSNSVAKCIEQYGGIDIVVSNAGVFPEAKSIEDLPIEDLLKTSQVNFISHVELLKTCIPYLKRGVDPSFVIVGSKNVPAPGPGAAAYSSTKAALTQIARVAALELGKDNIRVNVIHPNAVFDTAIWSEDTLRDRAIHYGMTVQEYKANNVLKTEISSKDVADMIVTMSGKAFFKTTGAQIPIDGGNDRVI